MPRLKDIAPFFLIIPLLLLFVFVALPILVFILMPIGLLVDYRAGRRYKAYLRSINGAAIFCYSNNDDSFDYVIDEILPRLNEKVEILLVKSYRVESTLDNEHMSHLLFKQKNYTRFPYLIKIRNGRATGKSIRHLLDSDQPKNPQPVMEEINRFFRD